MILTGCLYDGYFKMWQQRRFVFDRLPALLSQLKFTPRAAALLIKLDYGKPNYGTAGKI